MRQRAPWWVRRESIRLQCGRPGFDTWVRKIPGGEIGYPLQYPCLENPIIYNSGSQSGVTLPSREHQETLLAVLTKGYCQHLVSRGQGCCQTPHNTPHHGCPPCSISPNGFRTGFFRKVRQKDNCCLVAQSYLTLCDPIDCSMTGLPFFGNGMKTDLFQCMCFDF